MRALLRIFQATKNIVPIHGSRLRSFASSARELVSLHQHHLEVDLKGSTRCINYQWLRVNCTCPLCYNKDTLQKNIPIHQLDSGIKPVQNWIDGETFSVTWSDGHTSRYDLKWLDENVFPTQPKPITPQFLWNKETLSNQSLKLVPFEEFMNEESGLRTLLGGLLKYGFGIVEGAPVNIEGTQQVAERLCFIQETLYGRMWSFTSNLARADTAYTSLALGAHTDGTYWTTPPGIQVFHRLEHEGEGGQTLLVDGFQCVQELKRTKPDSYKLLKELKIPHEYREVTPTNPNHVNSLDTIIKAHPITDELIWLRYNQYDRAPITNLDHEQVNDFYSALTDLARILERPENEYWLPLKSGQVLFVDNWRTLHGRASFNGLRRVAGCYLPRDDWTSKARVLGLL